jgi:glycosyltransferase involved in cell wall biosynthesis
VAIVDPTGGHGGSHHLYLFGQALGLRELGFETFIYTCDESSLEFKQGDVFLVYRNIFTSSPKWILGLRYLRGTFKSLFDVLKRRIPYIHFHHFQAGLLEFFNVILFKLFRRKVVVTIHDVEGFFKKQRQGLRKRMYKMVDALTVQNEFSKKELLSIDPSLADKLHVIPHGNYLPFLKRRYTDEESRSKLGIANDRKVILFFGMIKDVKGLDVLLKALPAVVEADPSVLLIIAGKDWENDFSKYQKLIDEHSLQDHCVIHEKYIPNEEVELYFNSSDIVAIPYRKIYQSGVLLMAMSYGKPVIVSDLPPMLEVVDDMKTGFVFKSENEEDLARKLTMAFNSEAKLIEVTHAAMDKLKKKYDWKEIGKQLEKVYR